MCKGKRNLHTTFSHLSTYFTYDFGNKYKIKSLCVKISISYKLKINHSINESVFHDVMSTVKQPRKLKLPRVATSPTLSTPPPYP